MTALNWSFVFTPEVMHTSLRLQYMLIAIVFNPITSNLKKKETKFATYHFSTPPPNFRTPREEWKEKTLSMHVLCDDARMLRDNVIPVCAPAVFGGGGGGHNLESQDRPVVPKISVQSALELRSLERN